MCCPVDARGQSLPLMSMEAEPFNNQPAAPCDQVRSEQVPKMLELWSGAEFPQRDPGIQPLVKNWGVNTLKLKNVSDMSLHYALLI